MLRKNCIYYKLPIDCNEIEILIFEAKNVWGKIVAGLVVNLIVDVNILQKTDKSK